MNHLISPWLRRVFVLVAAAGICHSVVPWLQRSEWNKERYYRRLVSERPGPRAQAAERLVELGGQEQLIRGLLSDSAEVRAIASEALWDLWIRSAGQEAYRRIREADEAAAKQRYDEALRILDQVLADHPDFAEGWNRRAIVHWQVRRYRRSMQDCQRAVSLNPCHFGAWHGMALCQAHLGNLLGARWSLQAVLRLNPHDENARKFLRACDELLRRIQPKAGDMMDQV